MLWATAILQSAWLHTVRRRARQWPPSYAYAAETVALGAAAMLSSLCSGIWLPKNTGLLHCRQVHNLDVDAAAWQAFVASVQRPASCVELYNLL